MPRAEAQAEDQTSPLVPVTLKTALSPMRERHLQVRVAHTPD